ncbi:MAG: GNAT family N-acetyltransferase [Acidimicrobiales bacterium]
MVLRRARVEEIEDLTRLALRSKAHWGYDAQFIEACRDELTVRPEDLITHRLTVAVDETTHRLLGFYGLVGTDSDDAELSTLFVEPEVIGTGVGALLFDDAVRAARDAGFSRFRIEADPFAAGFYEHVGAEAFGTTASHSIADRELPLFVMDVS